MIWQEANSICAGGVSWFDIAHTWFSHHFATIPNLSLPQINFEWYLIRPRFCIFCTLLSRVNQARLVQLLSHSCFTFLLWNSWDCLNIRPGGHLASYFETHGTAWTWSLGLLLWWKNLRWQSIKPNLFFVFTLYSEDFFAFISHNVGPVNLTLPLFLRRGIHTVDLSPFNCPEIDNQEQLITGQRFIKQTWQLK
jgi:hypothetical protein